MSTLRRICMWITVGCLLFLGITSLMAAALNWGRPGGWTFYTANAPAPAPWAIDMAVRLDAVARVLRPIAAISGAGYILLLEYALQHQHFAHGFDVQTRRIGERE